MCYFHDLCVKVFEVSQSRGWKRGHKPTRMLVSKLRCESYEPEIRATWLFGRPLQTLSRCTIDEQTYLLTTCRANHYPQGISPTVPEISVIYLPICFTRFRFGDSVARFRYFKRWWFIVRNVREKCCVEDGQFGSRCRNRDLCTNAVRQFLVKSRITREHRTTTNTIHRSGVKSSGENFLNLEPC